MTKGQSVQGRVLEANCSFCGTGLNLRLPKGLNDGEFTVRCYRCGTPLKVIVSPEGRSRKVTIEGKPKKTVLSLQKKEIEPEMVGPPKLELDRGKLPHKKRLRVAFMVLILVGLLGVLSSILTLTGSFRIKDLEEQSPNDKSDLNLWVLDESNGRGVLGAKVTLTSDDVNYTSYSDQEGLAILRDVRLGSMELTISKDGFRTVKGMVEIKRGTPNVLDIPLHRGDPSETSSMPVQQFKDRTYDPLLTDLAAILMMLSGLMAFVGAFFVLIRDFFLLALVASFMSIFSLGFFIGSVLAILAIVIIILSYEGFEHSHQLERYLELYGKSARERIRAKSQRPLKFPPTHR